MIPLLPLKLVLVPTFLLLLTIASKRWGPSVGGWLAGLPLVTGPILLFLSIEQGASFAAHAAAATLSAALAFVAFSWAYSHAAQRLPWMPSLLIAWLAWGVAALALSSQPVSPQLACVLAIFSLSVVPRFFPHRLASLPLRAVTPSELGCRMLAGAALTLAVTGLAATVGSAWSGLLAGFPVLGSVLAVFAHRGDGPTTATLLLRGMLTGLFSVVAFCFLLSLALPHLPLPLAFTAALLSACLVQLASRRFLPLA